jgi:3'(2'), 5'-bisphosphate nucleotidase
MIDLSYLVVKIKDISIEAGKGILDIYDSGYSVEHKDDRSPLTEADMISHNMICKHLSELTPDIPVLSEESSAIPYEKRQTWQRYWLVDPLDGTREFINRNGEFTVNIALVENHNPVLGVVHVPVNSTTYFACIGSGAFKQFNDQTPGKITTRKTDPSKITVAGSRSHGSARQQAFIKKLGDVEVFAIGSSLKFCMVAEGRVDIYPRFGPTSEWDTAAAQCIVEEAGGIVVEENFKSLRYNSNGSLLNPSFLVIGDPAFDWRPYLSI